MSSKKKNKSHKDPDDIYILSPSASEPLPTCSVKYYLPTTAEASKALKEPVSTPTTKLPVLPSALPTTATTAKIPTNSITTQNVKTVTVQTVPSDLFTLREIESRKEIKSNTHSPYAQKSKCIAKCQDDALNPIAQSSFFHNTSNAPSINFLAGNESKIAESGAQKSKDMNYCCGGGGGNVNKTEKKNSVDESMKCPTCGQKLPSNNNVGFTASKRFQTCSDKASTTCQVCAITKSKSIAQNDDLSAIELQCLVCKNLRESTNANLFRSNTKVNLPVYQAPITYPTVNKSFISKNYQNVSHDCPAKLHLGVNCNELQSTSTISSESNCSKECKSLDNVIEDKLEERLVPILKRLEKLLDKNENRENVGKNYKYGIVEEDGNWVKHKKNNYNINKNSYDLKNDSDEYIESNKENMDLRGKCLRRYSRKIENNCSGTGGPLSKKSSDTFSKVKKSVSLSSMPSEEFLEHSRKR